MNKLLLSLFVAPVFIISSNAFASSNHTHAMNGDMNMSHFLTKTYVSRHRNMNDSNSDMKIEIDYHSMIQSKISLFSHRGSTQKTAMDDSNLNFQSSMLSKRVLFSHAGKMEMMEQLNS